MATPLINLGEDYPLLDSYGRIAPNLDGAPVRGVLYVAQQVLKRWLSELGYVWYAVDCGANLLDLLNGVVTQADLYAKSGELRTQAMAVDGVTDCSVTIEYNKVTKAAVVLGKLDVVGSPINMRINLNNGSISASMSAA